MNERQDAAIATHAPASRRRKRRPSFLRPAECLTFGAIAVALAALFLWLFAPLLFPASTPGDPYAQFRTQAPFGKLTLFPLQSLPGRVYNLLQDTTTPTRLWAATERGFHVSNDSGQTWHLVGKDLDFASLLQDATTPTRLWAARGRGLYVSDDSGQTWRLVSESLPRDEYVANLLQDATTPTRLWAARGRGFHVSNDSGQTWRLVGESLLRGGYVDRLLQDATAPARLWAATEGGLCVSDDSGQTWRLASENLKSVHVHSLRQDVRNPQRLLGRINNSPAFSPDGGKSWKNMYGDLPVNIEVGTIIQSHRFPEVLYLGTNQGVYWSDDNGARWQRGSSPEGPEVGISFEQLVPSTDTLAFFALSTSELYWVFDGVPHTVRGQLALWIWQHPIAALLVSLGALLFAARMVYPLQFRERHLAWVVSKARLRADPTQVLVVLQDIFRSDDARIWFARTLSPARLSAFEVIYNLFADQRLEQSWGDVRTRTIEALAAYHTDHEAVAAPLREAAMWSRRGQVSGEKVRHTAQVLEHHAASLLWGAQMASFWHSLAAAVEIRTVQDILTQTGRFEETAHLLRQADFFRPELTTILDLELESLGFLRRYVAAQTPEGQVAFLTKALASLERARAHTADYITPPEGLVLRTALDGWTTIFRQALEDLQGTARVRLGFKSQTVERQEEVTLLADLANEGQGYAEDLTITLLPSDAYTAADVPLTPAYLDLLPANTTHSIRLQLHPSGQERFIVTVRIGYHDIHGEKEETFTEEISLIERTSVFTAFDNPYRTGQPIREKESKVFYGRSDVFSDITRILDENARKPEGKSLILLVGERRMGKTSVLLQLDHQLSERYVPVFLDIQGFSDAGSAAFLYWLGVRVGRKLRERGVAVELPMLQTLQEVPTIRFEEFLTDQVLPVLADRHLVLLFDEFEHMQDLIEQGKQESNILLFLRDLMQHAPKLSFIFAGTYGLQEIASTYQSIMFNIARTLKLGDLSAEDTRRLLTEPVADVLDYEPKAHEYVYQLTRGHPFFTQILCYEIVEHQKQRYKTYTTVTDVEEAVRYLVDTGHAHFNYIFTRLSPPERLLLSGTAVWTDGQRPIIAADVVSNLRRYRIEMSLYDVAQLLDQLAQRGLLIEQRQRDSSDYRFRMELVRRWLVRHRPFEEVLSQS